MKNNLDELVLVYFDKHSQQYSLIKINYYDQRWRNAHFSSIFIVHLVTPYFSYRGKITASYVWLTAAMTHSFFSVCSS
jgi:hypothetical protein